MARITDEMLMAYADGELEPAAAADLRRAIDADPELARRLDLFSRTRSAAKAAFDPVLEEDVPPELVASVRGSAPVRRRLGRLWIPVGAAIAAALVGYAGGARLGSAPTVPGAFPGAEIAAAVSGLPTGATAEVAGASVEVAGSYATADGYCRVLAVALDAAGWRAVACGSGGRWTMEMVVSDSSVASGGYVPASGGATASIDAFLDAVGAGAGLDAAAEQGAIAGGWKPGAAE